MPGEEIELFEWTFDLRPKGESDKQEWSTITLHGTGKFSLQYERIVGPTISNPEHPDPALDKLATGKLELEIKEQEREGVTAWGKEVGGLQAGLGFRSGEKRAYSHGEIAKVVARIRNVGKDRSTSLRYVRWIFASSARSSCVNPRSSRRFRTANPRTLHLLCLPA